MDQATVRDNAASWHDRMHRGKVSEETRAAFARWLAESPDHRAAYHDMDRLWSSLKSAAADPQILALRHETALRLTRHNWRNVRTSIWRFAAVIVVALGGAIVLGGFAMRDSLSVAALFDVFRNPGNTRYATATGERLNVTLNDGSQLTLNTQTELTVAFTRAERTVHLVRGQAFFEVAKDPSRPFVVNANRRRLVAIGTAFDVRLDGQRVDVTMLEGAVRVERADASAAVDGASDNGHREEARDTPAARTARETSVLAPAVATIVAGQQLTAQADSQDRVRNADADRVTSWRNGQVIFENTRLADAVDEINRYSDRKINLADSSLAELRLSGGFATGRPEVFVEAVTSYFPLEIMRSDEHTIVLGARN